MEDFELTLFDRLNAIRDTINKYGEENFYLSFSGGKDSTILHYLIDMALPNNKIPRVFINTGIEYIYIYIFVKELADNDDRFVIIKPQMPIKKMLEENGYPFKSKVFAKNLNMYQRLGKTKTVRVFLGEEADNNGEYRTGMFSCPAKLKYLFSEENKLKINDVCCSKLKKEPSKKWAKENNKKITITGMRKEEGGSRLMLGCITNKGTKFNPLVVVSEEFEEWFIKTYNIKICKLYLPPFNFKRTGCKGCPFALNLQKDLDVMEKYLPAERKQCEAIWKPVYDEYRRINYRLKDNVQEKLDI